MTKERQGWVKTEIHYNTSFWREWIFLFIVRSSCLEQPSACQALYEHFTEWMNMQAVGHSSWLLEPTLAVTSRKKDNKPF